MNSPIYPCKIKVKKLIFVCGFNNYLGLSDEYDNVNKSIPMIGIAGNHDLIGNSLDTLPSTTLGLLSSLGLMRIVSKDNPVFFETEDGLKVAITGTSYHLHQDEKEYIDDYIVKEKLGDIHIHLVHGMLSEKDLGSLIKHTLIDNILNDIKEQTGDDYEFIGWSPEPINITSNIDCYAQFKINSVNIEILSTAFPETYGINPDESFMLNFGNTVYVASLYNKSAIYKFDVVSETVTTITEEFPYKNYKNSKGVTIGTQGYIFGGYNSTLNATNILKFDSTNETTILLDTIMPIHLSYPSLCAVGNDIYIFGGDSNGTTTIYKFDTINLIIFP